MLNYEVLYILSPDLKDEEREAISNKFKDFIEKDSGSVARIDKWEKRTLAYPIKFKKEGYYVLMTYSSSPKTSIAMGKLMLITEGILRYLIVRK